MIYKIFCINAYFCFEYFCIMKNTIFLLIVVFVSVYLYNGCAEDIIKKDGGDEIDTNILRTDEFGNILGGDTTDWCIDTTGGFSFGPAYPNPVYPTVRIKYRILQNDTITISIRNSLGGGDSVLFQGPVLAGYYERDINGTNYLNTFKEVCITSKLYSSHTGCNLCGDLKFAE